MRMNRNSGEKRCIQTRILHKAIDSFSAKDGIKIKKFSGLPLQTGLERH